MFDIGWTELLVIGVVALIVVGPKDLPGMFRTLGQFTAKARGMAREFQRAMEQAADDAGVKDVTRDLKNVANPRKMGIDAFKDATRDLGKLDLDAEKKPKPKGPATQKMSEERAEKAAHVRDVTAKKAAKRRAAPVEPAPATPNDDVKSDG